MIRHLFVPGLLGPVSLPAATAKHAFPMLERLLARAERVAEPPDYAQALFGVFGREPPPGTDVPSAALCWLAETGERAPGCRMHADPLHLVPDRDSLLAFDLAEEMLDDAEAGQLVDAFNSHFGEEGLVLSRSPGGQLQLRCSTMPKISTCPLSSVIGRHLDRYLPAGEEGPRWQGLMNETQMLCHALPFNRAREASGRPTLDGLWFNGAGVLPGECAGPVGRLEGDCQLAQGLYRLAVPRGEDELVVDHAVGRAVQRADAVAWLRAVERVEARMPGWMRGCEELHLHPCVGAAWRWRPRSAWRIWRRPRPLVTQAAVR